MPDGGCRSVRRHRIRADRKDGPRRTIRIRGLFHPLGQQRIVTVRRRQRIGFRGLPRRNAPRIRDRCGQRSQDSSLHRNQQHDDLYRFCRVRRRFRTGGEHRLAEGQACRQCDAHTGLPARLLHRIQGQHLFRLPRFPLLPRQSRRPGQIPGGPARGRSD